MSSNTDTSAMHALIQTFTDHCAQMGHHGVQLKIQPQGQSQASVGGDASDQAGGVGNKRDLSPSPTQPEEPQTKDSKKS
eukprot:5691859-Karenia_brevis.AAC.1